MTLNFIVFSIDQPATHKFELHCNRNQPADTSSFIDIAAAQDYPRERLEVLVVDDSPGGSAWPALCASAPARSLGGALRYIHYDAVEPARARCGPSMNKNIG